MTVTKEEAFSLIPVQENAPLFKVCAGIDTAHSDLKASIYFDYVRRQLSNLGSDMVTDDDMFVLADLLEMCKALRCAGGAR
ncbi:hypothetical protein B9Y60_06775 [Stenotrophomonas maltophilia]|uniref:hypothetical protein n=1 Tax=Stenotrophomonas TaxID=40323 RepID=UPI000C262958|nr:hypothetical protein [Stenotrophomonas maltophilia]PJL54964.1 hypothetical protein B9Y73_06775 [Stenotrophomonas maltophilia]PJL56607.1 hypothetical protein B9Y60_06775 [Stenotrophomonas maltophilia]